MPTAGGNGFEVNHCLAAQRRSFRVEIEEVGRFRLTESVGELSECLDLPHSTEKTDIESFYAEGPRVVVPVESVGFWVV
jgi:hypothetical protein